MTPDQYLKDSARTMPRDYYPIADRFINGEGDPNENTIDLLHAAIGVSTEAGELLDMVKKHLFYGKPIDTVNLQEECGDVLWYIAIICRGYGISLETLMQMNIDKLKKRFPAKFEETQAIHRDTVNELSHIKELGK